MEKNVEEAASSNPLVNPLVFSQVDIAGSSEFENRALTRTVSEIEDDIESHNFSDVEVSLCGSSSSSGHYVKDDEIIVKTQAAVVGFLGSTVVKKIHEVFENEGASEQESSDEISGGASDLATRRSEQCSNFDSGEALIDVTLKRSSSEQSFEQNEQIVHLTDTVDDLEVESETVKRVLLKTSMLSDPGVPDDTTISFRSRKKIARQSSEVSGSSCGNEDPDYVVEFFDKASDEAESRLAARRQARAEAREIRMRELEKQQRESEENADKHYEMTATSPDPPPLRPVASISTGRLQVQARISSSGLHLSSRRSSEDSNEEAMSLRETKYELREVEEKFRRAMVANAQLDNEKSALTYQITLLKDQLEEMQESNSRVQKESREHKREGEQLKLLASKLKEEADFLRRQMEERDRLIEEHSLVLVGDSGSDDSSDEEGERSRHKKGGDRKPTNSSPRKALVCQEVAQLLEKAGEGSLDVRIRRLTEDKRDLSDQVRRLRLELEEERTSHLKQKRLAAAALASAAPPMPNGIDSDPIEMQREIAKQTNDYKFKLQKAEQEVATLQANVSRLESQVQRFKSAADASEKAEDELKAEKRKLQRELREAQTRLEELETSHSHLQKRLDKLKSAKSALLKDI